MQNIKIGEYEIEQINEDEFEIIYPYSTGGYARTIVCGGDFETVLGTLFIGNKVEVKYSYQIEEERG